MDGGAAGTQVDTFPERFWRDMPLGEDAGHAGRGAWEKRMREEAAKEKPRGSVQRNVSQMAVQRGRRWTLSRNDHGGMRLRMRYRAQGRDEKEKGVLEEAAKERSRGSEVYRRMCHRCRCSGNAGGHFPEKAMVKCASG